MTSFGGFKTLGILGFMLLAGCSTSTWKLQNSPDLLAAQSEVKVSKEDNGNRRLNLKFAHLPKPEKIFNGAKTYVVWAAPRDASGVGAQNIGAFSVNDDLEGSLQTITPHERFELFVTAESVKTATIPSSRKLLWTTIE